MAVKIDTKATTINAQNVLEVAEHAVSEQRRIAIELRNVRYELQMLRYGAEFVTRFGLCDQTTLRKLNDILFDRR